MAGYDPRIPDPSQQQGKKRIKKTNWKAYVTWCVSALFLILLALWFSPYLFQDLSNRISRQDSSQQSLSQVSTPTPVFTYTPTAAPTKEPTTTPTSTRRPTVTQTPIPTRTSTPAYHVKDDANIRGGPGINFDIVGGRKANDSLIPMARTVDGQWVKISHNEWIWAGLVSGEVERLTVTYNLPATPTPIPEPTATPIPIPIFTPTPHPTPEPHPCSGALPVVDYNDLHRNIERHKGRMIKFTGGIAQSLYNEQHPAYLVAITYEEFVGWYDVIRVSTNEHTNLNTRLLEGDFITFCGMPIGLYRYDTVEGKVNEVPHVLMVQFFGLVE